MRLFVDTGALVARHNKDDENHEKAVSTFEQISSSALQVGKLYCSDYVVDEAVTTCYARTKSRERAIELGETILNSKSVVLLKVGWDIFLQARRFFREKYLTIPLSFTDCTTAVLLEKNNIRTVFGFDRDFEALGYTLIPKWSREK